MRAIPYAHTENNMQITETAISNRIQPNYYDNVFTY